MLPKRLKTNLSQQNWSAILFDLGVVILGVFLGIQLGNLNDNRIRNAEFSLAKERLLQEVDENLSTLSILERETRGYIGNVSAGFEALSHCDSDKKEQITRSINGATGTYGIKLRTDALNQLLNFEQLQQSKYKDLRNTLSDVKWFVELSLREADVIEMLPLEFPVTESPAVAVSTIVDEKPVEYIGNNYTRKVRQLTLSVPVEQACQDQQLLKSLYHWERWQGFLPRMISNLTQRFEGLKQQLTAPNQTQ